MRTRILWIIVGLAFLVSQNVFCKNFKPVKKKGETVDPGKKADIGNIDTKKKFAKITPKQCKDAKHEVCKKMIKVNSAACALNPAYMEENCLLTCRFCSPGRKSKDCKDEDSRCKLWNKNDCVHFTPFMKDRCTKTCGLCGEIDGVTYTDEDYRCHYWGVQGICKASGSVNKKIKGGKSMLELCPFSCKKYENRRLHVYRAAKHHKKKHHVKSVIKHHHPKPPPPKPLKLTEDEKEEKKALDEEWQEEMQEREIEKAEKEKERKEINLDVFSTSKREGEKNIKVNQ